MVQLDNAIQYFSKKILNELPTKAWVAGGCVRDYFSIGYTTSDIDLFFENEENMMASLECIKSKGGKVYFENENVYKVSYKRMKLDFVKKYYPNPSTTIQHFDFTVCCCAVSKDEVKYHDTFFIDLSKKQLMMNNVLYPLSTMWRTQKYHFKGFRMCKGEMLKLVEAIQSINNQDHISNSEGNSNQNDEMYPDDDMLVFKGID